MAVAPVGGDVQNSDKNYVAITGCEELTLFASNSSAFHYQITEVVAGKCEDIWVNNK